MPFAESGCKKGQTTIQNLRLDREILNKERLGHLQTIKFLHKIIQIAPTRPSDQEFQELAQKAEISLKIAVADGGQFAAATRSALATNFEFVIE
jgi:hypothetical protein